MATLPAAWAGTVAGVPGANAPSAVRSPVLTDDFAPIEGLLKVEPK